MAVTVLDDQFVTGVDFGSNNPIDNHTVDTVNTFGAAWHTDATYAGGGGAGWRTTFSNGYVRTRTADSINYGGRAYIDVPLNAGIARVTVTVHIDDANNYVGATSHLMVQQLTAAGVLGNGKADFYSQCLTVPSGTSDLRCTVTNTAGSAASQSGSSFTSTTTTFVVDILAGGTVNLYRAPSTLIFTDSANIFAESGGFFTSYGFRIWIQSDELTDCYYVTATTDVLGTTPPPPGPTIGLWTDFVNTYEVL